MRLGRLADERERTEGKIGDMLAHAEDGERGLSDAEQEQVGNYRSRLADLDVEIGLLAADLERANGARDVSALLRDDAQARHEAAGDVDGPVVYRTFAAYVRDAL